ncbi:hypothetical protein M5689_008382 [Euphorbia peplus]|nr:hypothetical protein M5689_008382 [Euphorbia peplus]
MPDTQDQESENGETIKRVKIHQPKAVRVSSVLLESRNTSRIGEFDYEGWKEDENGVFCGFVSSSPCQSFIRGNDGDNMMMLDEVFDEYDQLLKTDENGRLDSFIDSLLAE